MPIPAPEGRLREACQATCRPVFATMEPAPQVREPAGRSLPDQPRGRDVLSHSGRGLAAAARCSLRGAGGACPLPAALRSRRPDPRAGEVVPNATRQVGDDVVSMGGSQIAPKPTSPGSREVGPGAFTRGLRRGAGSRRSQQSRGRCDHLYRVSRPCRPGSGRTG